MIIKDCNGYELKKEKSNTSEDFFNRSEVTYVINGEERKLSVLYVRYFDELFPEFTPFKENPIFKVGGRDVHFKDIVALVALMKNPRFQERKRVYINAQSEFQSLFQGFDFRELPQLFQQMQEQHTEKL
ncbi:hypothetical protein [Bacillus massilinigeriensis]|uniref:hypothetical protein n=1 Tax=Bacillus massilionigeriensis TaxID=1805475 RepID=UPI00096AF39C|nr:hypothetical protein [Bacillus massilionigeriensis]